MESKKGARPYRVRFRHSTCPSTTVTGADYKKYDFFFDSNQVWLKTRKSLTFHDQSRSIYYDANNAEEESENEVILDRIELNTPSLGTLHQSASYRQDLMGFRDEPTQAIQPPRHPPELAQNRRMSTSITPGGDGIADDVANADCVANHDRCTHAEDPAEGFDCDVPISRFPNSCRFDNAKDAFLFRHYVENLARWFDVCNPHRPFTYAVPRMAASSPLLRKAILAHSAHHISRVTGSDRSLPFQYLEDCLALLIPKLKNEPISSVDDGDLIATIFLRSFGEFEDIAAGEFHVSGTALFIQSGGGCESLRRSNRLINAAYWVHLRQEICSSLGEQRNIRANLNICPFDISTDPSSDAGWCNRVVWICVQVLRWAFGPTSTLERWKQLNVMIEDWETRRPKTFEPMLDMRGPFDTLDWDKEVWFTNDEHVDAMIYLLTAKLILSLHDPSLPRIGLRAQIAASNQKAMNQFYVRAMCTAAKCSSFVPAKFKACDVLFACGGCFHLKGDQENVVSFLRACERDHGYNTKAHVDAMLNVWSTETYH